MTPDLFPRPDPEALAAERDRLTAELAEHSSKAARSVREAWEHYTAADVDLDWSVRAARAAGLTWAQIGEACGGMTRQTAQSRWGGPRG